MANQKLTKKQIVKHHTRSAPQKSRGFQVGRKNLPDGAYLGKAKRIKSELIHKAQVKKQYFRQLQKEPSSASSSSALLSTQTQDQGRFKPETQTDDQDQQGQQSISLPILTAPEKRHKVHQTKKPLPHPLLHSSRPPPPPQPESKPKDDKMADREKNKQLWNKKSPSKLGSKRGQPDLSARMEVMLEKIRKGL